MSQRGHIRTKARCPNCGGKFTDTGKGWECPKCSTTPNRFYVDLSWEGKRTKIFKDTSGLVLDSYDRAARLLTHIRWEIDNHKFDPKKYIRTQYEPYFMANFALKWIKEQEIRHEAKEISFSTIYKYKMIVNNFIISYFGRSDIRTIWTRGVKDFNIHLAELKISPKYREDILGVLRKMFNDALQSEDIDRGQLPVFPTVEVPDLYFSTLTEAQQDEILGKIPEHDHPIFHLILWYGLRPSEARAIRRDAIIGDFDKIVIRRTFTRNNRLRENPKENKWRMISLLDETKEILRCLTPSLSGFLFVNQWGRHYSQTYLNETWNRE